VDCHILVTQPKALIGLILTHEKLLHNLKVLVLDIADKLLGPKYKKDVMMIIENTVDVTKRQTLLFPVTIFPQRLEVYTKGIMKEDKTILDEYEEPEFLVETAQSKILVCSMEKLLYQFGLLLQELTKLPLYKILVFVPTCAVGDFLSELYRSIYPSLLFLHSGILKEDRTIIINNFHNSSKIMFLMDLLQSESDYQGVTHIIQLALPPTAEDCHYRFSQIRELGSWEEILIISDWESETLYPRVFEGTPKPKILECFPENEDYYEMKEKLITQAREIPKKLLNKAFQSMIQLSIPLKEVHLSTVKNQISLFFIDSMDFKDVKEEVEKVV